MKISFSKYISQTHRLELYNLLADLIDEGVPLFDALTLVNSDDGAKVYGKGFIKKLEIIVDKMKQSSSVTEVLAEVVPPQDLTVINAAEQAGQLSDGMRMLVAMLKKNDELISKLRQALITPIVLVIIVLVVIMGYSLNVFPTFLGVLPLSSWPQVTKNLYGFGNYLAQGGLPTILIVAAGVSALVRASMPLIKGEFRNRYLDKVPPYNYYRIMQLGLFLRMLSTLMANNIPMVESLNLMKQRASPWMKYHLEHFTKNMSDGKSYKDSLDTGFLTAQMLLTINVYSSLDSFADTVTKMAENCDSKIVQDIETLSGIMKNLSMICLAGAVMWIFAGIFALIDQLGASA